MSQINGALTGIYTITALHCGVGQAISAVDLPIAREKHTELPYLPSTSLKGVARDAMRPDQDRRKDPSDEDRRREADWIQLFGSPPPGRESAEARENRQKWTAEQRKAASGKASEEGDSAARSGGTDPGSLVFTDARLLLLPMRCLQRSFVYVTSPFLIDRLVRDMRAFGIEVPKALEAPSWQQVGQEGALVTDGALASLNALVIEDRVYTKDKVRHVPALAGVAEALGVLVPEAEGVARGRLKTHLVVIRDEELKDLCQEAVPVVARTQLTDGKTTDKWWDPADPTRPQSGNLWYQEQLPSDCLFYAIITSRAGAEPLSKLRKDAEKLRRVQIGGGETVGLGQCWWQVTPPGRKP